MKAFDELQECFGIVNDSEDYFLMQHQEEPLEEHLWIEDFDEVTKIVLDLAEKASDVAVNALKECTEPVCIPAKMLVYGEQRHRIQKNILAVELITTPDGELVKEV